MPSPRAGPSSPEGAPDVGMENKSPDLGSEEQDQPIAETPKDNLAGPLSQEAEAGKAGVEQQEPQTKKPKLEKQERHKKGFSIQVLVTGQTGGCEDLFLKKVSDHLPKINLKPERYREDSGHFLLVFCPVTSRVGTDMQNALEHLQGKPKAILVMLHHKPKEYDRFLDTTLQAQHPAVVLTIHARYTLEDGLYDCQVNEEAVAAVAEILKVHHKEMENKSPDLGSEKQGQAIAEPLKDDLPGPVSQEAKAGKVEAKQKEPQMARKKPKQEKQRRPKKVFNIQVLVRGKTGGCEDLFLKTVSGRLSGNRIKLKPERYREDSGHFLLVFCPVASRLGTDMQNALEHLQGEPKAVLVMLHHKPKEYNRFLDTTLQAQHPAVVLTVHARYTLEDGLYNCQENKEAVATVANVLKVHCKEVTPPNYKSQGSRTARAVSKDRFVKEESKHLRGNPPDSASHRLEHQRQKQKPPADRRGERLEDWEPRKERKWYSCCKKDFPIQVLVTGQIGDCCNEFLQRVSDCLPKINLKTKGYREDCGHFLLVFCPVTSSVDIDMANALEGLHCEPKAVLVMLHHKPKESTSLVDTGKQAQHRAVECTVHTRFTLEDGFYFCQTNKEAVAIVVKVLEECAASQMGSCFCFR